MAKSGSRRRTRKVAAGVLDRLAAHEGAESRSRKKSTRKVSAQILDTLRDNTQAVPSTPQIATRAPGYGIVKRRRVRSDEAQPKTSTQEHARLRPPVPPDTGSGLGELRRAVDLDPPPLRLEPDTNPEMMIGGGAFDAQPLLPPSADTWDDSPPSRSDARPLKPLRTDTWDESPPSAFRTPQRPLQWADLQCAPVLDTETTPSEDAAWLPIAVSPPEEEEEEAWSVPSVVISDSAFGPQPALAAATHTDVQEPSPTLPGSAELAGLARPPRGFLVRIRAFLAGLRAVWRSTR